MTNRKIETAIEEHIIKGLRTLNTNDVSQKLAEINLLKQKREEIVQDIKVTEQANTNMINRTGVEMVEFKRIVDEMDRELQVINERIQARGTEYNLLLDDLHVAQK